MAFITIGDVVSWEVLHFERIYSCVFSERKQMENDLSKDKNLMEDLAAEVQCHICLELFEDPRLLGCGHTFCKDCLVQCGNARVSFLF